MQEYTAPSNHLYLLMPVASSLYSAQVKLRKQLKNIIANSIVMILAFRAAVTVFFCGNRLIVHYCGCLMHKIF